MNIVVPLAGKDKAFEEKGLPKPLTPVCGKPIIRHIAESRPYPFTSAIFILLREHEEKYGISGRLREFFGEKIRIVWAEQPTDGAPQSILLAKKHIDTDEPLLIDLADQYLDAPGLMDFCTKTDAAGVIPTFESYYYNRGYMLFNPDGTVRHVSEKDKMPISTYSTACISYFARGKDFVRCAEKMIGGKKTAANGAYLVSLAFNELAGEGGKVATYTCDFIASLGIIEGALAFEQLDRPLKCADEIFNRTFARPAVIAHRSLIGNFQENSIEAIQNAIRHGFSIEIDVQVTKDGVPVLSHDKSTGRLFGKDMRIPDCNFAELKGLGRGVGKKGIATLSEALDALGANSISGCAMHIKESVSDSKLAEICNDIIFRKLQNRVFLFGNDENSIRILDKTKAIDPKIRAGLHVTADSDKLRHAEKEYAKADIIWIDALNSSDYSKYIDMAHRHGKKAAVISLELINPKIGKKKLHAHWKKIISQKADCICTDYPEGLCKNFP